MSSQQKSASIAYSSQPRQRRGNRRVTSGSAFKGAEPRPDEFLGQDAATNEALEMERQERLSRDRWLKEQRPPHHEIK